MPTRSPSLFSAKTWLLILFLIPVLLLGNQIFSVMKLSASVKQHAAVVMQNYQSIFAAHLPAIQQTPELTAQDRAMTQDLESSVALPAGGKPEDDVAAILSLQTKLGAVLARLATYDTLREHPDVVALRSETSNNGKIMESIESYNSTAADWNYRLEKGFGSFVTGSLFHVQPMNVLDTDGRVQQTTTIHL